MFEQDLIKLIQHHTLEQTQSVAAHYERKMDQVVCTIDTISDVLEEQSNCDMALKMLQLLSQQIDEFVMTRDVH